jgi:hypothetical protein
MVVILYQNGCRDVAEKTALELVGAFGDQVTIAQIAADSAGAWPAEISWDDLLIVLSPSVHGELRGLTASVTSQADLQVPIQPLGRLPGRGR